MVSYRTISAMMALVPSLSEKGGYTQMKATQPTHSYLLGFLSPHLSQYPRVSFATDPVFFCLAILLTLVLFLFLLICISLDHVASTPPSLKVKTHTKHLSDAHPLGC